MGTTVSRAERRLADYVIKRAIPLRAKEIEIEFGIPVGDAQYCQEQQDHVNSFIVVKVKRRIA